MEISLNQISPESPLPGLNPNDKPPALKRCFILDGNFFHACSSHTRGVGERERERERESSEVRSTVYSLSIGPHQRKGWFSVAMGKKSTNSVC